ncbi:PH domain-containing protein [Flexivirga sp.]|uniref:PH domain-containing protein n=1 Tax=Flexivirga sp. TaxID=1962927 RepID=UPI003F80B8F5
MDHVDPRAESAMARFLLDDETLVVAQRQHWASVAPPVAMAVAGFFLALIAGFSAPARLGALTDFAWKLWFLLLAYAVIRLVIWRLDWFVATDKRLLMMYGVLKRRVAMMPLAKVTDMSFNRTLLGQLFGYGQFVLESAGREQALRRIDFIRDAEGTYLAIVGEIFGEDDPEAAATYDAQDDTDPFLHLQLAGARSPGRRQHSDDPRHEPTYDPTYDPAYDPTDVPIRPIGTYLPRPERPRRSGLRERILRRAKDDRPAAFGHEGDTGWADQDPPAGRRRARDLGDD